MRGGSIPQIRANILDATSGLQQSVWKASVADYEPNQIPLVNEESKKTHPL